ncbi:hypothetical protein A2331_02530 [Candidatus Falkowbacteria bacterium RIFOXYB2_FULL_34_18]|uniref:Antitoxin Xre/MbcA/ParS-like toxin-binding domain-containing protein n=1 Tax=Candidatus Falkowbacteria bacterium RIFOXYD2_FULL_34_120 TaxID=1798007 RepID=A0A1F5TQI2_9BACT|nr:MAG: hypothetical protein A2331_02530 [Candidatus Falkowbacteria bacterium RIFOXYB2_FULL_34_18]OGF29497.1 MAG: hypothetical protein A2500_04380 [Candidatus Falkowbacteria bacterium RIFOXYC12_FULL_34_55]OGF36314.1 MAG: hypothetical protein A2466_05390 [Candidatus Falkowbacteria bacterium RIFOXYC2_FULL_34_220]OGF39023.1 MAG: hypothetical protein A2515_06845 [Candidatus Falkowbacteria bacterium RIFOXYD12_FULL_34_57]OGF41242.1 MAG: hypothetical protein A2531_01085 [Candidatus Falkowbacteria bact
MTKKSKYKENYQKIFKRAKEVFECSDEIIIRWINSPALGLGNKKPSEMLNTKKGTEKVLNLLGQIENGTFI